MLGNFMPHAADYLRFAPEIVLSVFGVVIMVLEAITSEARKTSLGILSLLGIVIAFAANAYAYEDPGQAFQNMITVDAYGTFFRGLVLVVGFLCVLMSFSYLTRERAQTRRVLRTHSVLFGWAVRHGYRE